VLLKVDTHFTYNTVHVYTFFSDSNKKFFETDIINMLYFMIAMFGGRVFQQTVGIPMGTTVLLFSPICSFIRMRQTPYRGFSRKRKKS
jgi:hypothetical protein